MLDLKGLYIKLGQVLSVTALPIPEAYRVLFRTLQSDVPGHEEFEAVVRPTLENELGQPLEDMFDFVEPVPCGAASIGQAHRARLKSKVGTRDDAERDVIIKVQYPDATWQVPADIRCVGDLLAVCVWFGVVDEDSARMSFDEFSRQFLAELDYDRERRNLQAVHRSSLDPESPYMKHNVIIPEVYADFCTSKVVTMQYLPGPTMEAEAKRQLQMLGIDTSGGIAKLIRDAANNAVKQPNGSASGELVRKLTTGRTPGRRSSFSWKTVAPGIVGRLVAFDSILWAVRGLKRWLLLAQAAAVTSINCIPKILVPSGLAEWADAHRSAATQADRLGQIEAWCRALFDVHGHQIFQLGLFNADPHPGNIVLTSVEHEGRRQDGSRGRSGKLNVGLIDYGQCKELTLEEQYKVAVGLGARAPRAKRARRSAASGLATMNPLGAMAMFLLSAGVHADEVEFQDTPMLSSLWEATSKNDNDAIDRLFDSSPNAAQSRASDGRGVAWWAYEFQNTYVLASILANGGDILSDDEDLSGQTAVQMCTENSECNKDELVEKAKGMVDDVKKRKEDRAKAREEDDFGDDVDDSVDDDEF